MAGNELAIKKLRTKRWKYENRCKWLVLFLILQFLIWWIQNPDFIPAISQGVTFVQEYFDYILLPHNAAELETGSYRVYIYQIRNWVQALPIYPMLEVVVPQILPAWLIVTIIQIFVVNMKIKKLQKPPKTPKAPKKTKENQPEQKNQASKVFAGPMVSGLDENYRREANNRLKILQDRCQNPFREDRGLWISNICPGANGKAPLDKIYHWNDWGVITLKYKENTFRFELYNDGARMIVHDRNWIQLKKGVPLAISHKNEAGQQILDMTVTWLGGIVK